jgi:hypothetical protein
VGGSNLVSVGGQDGFIAYSSAGVHQWSKRFGTSTVVEGGAAGGRPVGNVLLTGTAAWNLIVRKYDAAGTQLWAQQYGGPTLTKVPMWRAAPAATSS